MQTETGIEIDLHYIMDVLEFKFFIQFHVTNKPL